MRVGITLWSSGTALNNLGSLVSTSVNARTAAMLPHLKLAERQEVNVVVIATESAMPKVSAACSCAWVDYIILVAPIFCHAMTCCGIM